MLLRLFWLFTLIFTLFLMLGCSTPESQERVDTVLCWLRPSCLPSQLPSAKASATQAVPKPSPTPPKPKQMQDVSPQRRLTTPCVTSAKTTIQASKPYATITYVEPTTNANGRALTNLAKTTIYHDLGKGLVKYKDIPATKPQGGGTVQEKISFAVSKGTSIQVTICITATNTNGQEG